MAARASPREIDPAVPRAHVTAFPTITVSLLPGTLKGQNSSAIIELIVKYIAASACPRICSRRRGTTSERIPMSAWTRREGCSSTRTGPARVVILRQEPIPHNASLRKCRWFRGLLILIQCNKLRTAFQSTDKDSLSSGGVWLDFCEISAKRLTQRKNCGGCLKMT